jgi:hypothetical protein
MMVVGFFALALALVQAGSAAAAPRGSGIISGQGEWQYEYMPNLLQLPSSVDLLNGHGLCKDHAGNIYFTYQSATVAESTRALIKFLPDGTGAQLLGNDNTLAQVYFFLAGSPSLSRRLLPQPSFRSCQGVPHGLRIAYGEEGGPFLYHANNEATVHKTDLAGNIIWTANQAGFLRTHARVQAPFTLPCALMYTRGGGWGGLDLGMGWHADVALPPHRCRDHTAGQRPPLGHRRLRHCPDPRVY